jgi:hypothetical protein
MVIYTTGQIRKLNFYFKNPAIFKLHLGSQSLNVVNSSPHPLLILELVQKNSFERGIWGPKGLQCLYSYIILKNR